MTTDGELDGWIAQLRELPDDQRDFTVAPARARREFGVDAELLDELLARGLPHAGGGGDGPCCSPADLHFLALRLGCPTVYEGVLKRWAGALTAFSDRSETPIEIRCTAQLPAGGELELTVAPGEVMRAPVEGRAAQVRFAAVLHGELPQLPPALAPLLAELASYEFYWLHPPLETDLAFVRRTRLANCLSTAHLLAEQAPRLGVEARLAHGLLVAPPYSTPHNWAEVRCGEAWVPVDPLLLALLRRFADLDPAAWPVTRSPGAALLGLTEPGTPLARADGVPVEAAFLTRVVVDAP